MATHAHSADEPYMTFIKGLSLKAVMYGKRRGGAVRYVCVLANRLGPASSVLICWIDLRIHVRHQQLDGSLLG